MKTRETMKSVMCLLLIAAMGLSSCKKKDDPKPNPSANTDNVDMGTSSTTTITVLSNDSYTGSATLTITNNSNYGTLVVNTDKTITFTSRTNFYGTATLHYTLQDDNGSSTGSMIIKRGTAAQIKTYDIINKFYILATDGLLPRYAINGDSSVTYTSSYGNYAIDYGNFSSDLFIIFSNNVVIPEIGYNTYSIASDGNLVSLANDGNSTVVLEIVGEFTKSVKKRDGSGNYMSVSGYTIKYGTDVLDFTTRID